MKNIRFVVNSISVDQGGFSAIVDSKPSITVEMTVDGIDLYARGSGAELCAEIENRLNNPNYGIPRIKNVIFNEPATIVFWADGTKTVVKCQEGDIFDPEKGLTMAITKKALGNKGNYCNEIKKWCEPWHEDFDMESNWVSSTVTFSGPFDKMKKDLEDLLKKLRTQQKEDSNAR